MSALDETEERLPGLRFHVVSSALTKSFGGGVRTGTITLRCEVRELELWEMAVEKLNGLKLFSSTTEEMIAALSYELTHTDVRLQEALDREKELLEEISSKEEEVARLRGILRDIGAELGVE